MICWSLTKNSCNIQGWFFRLFNWFQLFYSENYFPKVAGHVQNRSKMTNLKGGVDGFSYFFILLVSVILFSNQDHPWIYIYSNICIACLSCAISGLSNPCFIFIVILWQRFCLGFKGTHLDSWCPCHNVYAVYVWILSGMETPSLQIMWKGMIFLLILYI